MTIINKHIKLSGNENGKHLVRLKHDAKRTLLNAVGKIQSPSKRKWAHRAIFLFDCMLRITRKSPIENNAFFSTKDFKRGQELFYGAIYSNRFVSYNQGVRKLLSGSFNLILTKIARNVPVIIVPVNWSESTLPPHEWIEKFEALNFDANEVRRLSGFYLEDKHGGRQRIRLEAIDAMIGRTFCDHFYSSLADIAKGKAKDSALRDFANTLNQFVHSCNKRINPSDFLNSEFTQHWWVNFMRFHFNKYINMEDGPEEGTLGSLQKLWSRYLLFIKKQEKAGLWTLPHSIPCGNPSLSVTKNIRHRKTEMRNGQPSDYTQKLLTQVPLQVTDKQAMKLLFCQIEQDFMLVKNWAFSGIEQLRKAHENSKTIEKQADFTDKTVNLAPEHFRPSTNKNALANTIWAIRNNYNGYVDTTKTRTPIYPFSKSTNYVPKNKVAQSMGLPSKNDCLLFAAYLMAVEPKLTENALLTAKACKANGTLIVPIDTDAGAVIAIRKDRAKTYHEIVLCKETSAVVEFLIELTNPIREYMRKNKIDGWQNLFVYSSTPLGKPAIFPKGYSTHNAFLKYVEGHREQLGLLADSLTLPRIRSSAGVVSYIKSLDINVMARTLGHGGQTSLRHYLPDSLWQFFNDRWIRIFQNLLISKAVRNTKYQVVASDFETIEELNTFLANHCLHELPDVQGYSYLKNPNSTTNNNVTIGEIVVLADEESWGVLFSVKSAVDNSKGKIHPIAKYWAEFAKILLIHIESPSYADAEIKAVLLAAQKHIRPNKFRKLVNE